MCTAPFISNDIHPLDPSVLCSYLLYRAATDMSVLLID